MDQPLGSGGYAARTNNQKQQGLKHELIELRCELIIAKFDTAASHRLVGLVLRGLRGRMETGMSSSVLF